MQHNVNRNVRHNTWPPFREGGAGGILISRTSARTAAGVVRPSRTHGRPPALSRLSLYLQREIKTRMQIIIFIRFHSRKKYTPRSNKMNNGNPNINEAAWQHRPNGKFVREAGNVASTSFSLHTSDVARLSFLVSTLF